MSASLSDGAGVSVPSFTFYSKHILRMPRDLAAPSTASDDRKTWADLLCFSLCTQLIQERQDYTTVYFRN